MKPLNKLAANSLLCFLFTAGWTCPQAAAEQLETQPHVAQVISVTQQKGQINEKAARFVVLNAGAQQGLRAGITLVASRLIQTPVAGRASHTNLFVPTGRIQVVEVSQDTALGKSLEETSELALAFFPKHPQVMAGDLLSPEPQALTEKAAIAPVIKLPFRELFVDPGQRPSTYALSARGRELLQTAAQEFFNLSPPQLMVEAFTDSSGPAEENFHETSQRAQIVRQFLLEARPFDASQILALGLGESETGSGNFASAYQGNQRYVVLRSNTVAH